MALEHGLGFSTYYAHNRLVVVKVGQKIKRGDILSYVGSTGNSTGPASALRGMERRKVFKSVYLYRREDMMFHKNTEKLESFIGTNSAFKGNVDSKGTLRVDGVVEGNISADWVIIGEKAHITGDITARGIVIGGKIDGNVEGKRNC